jgi:pimeloyl-ACP methyl ester carboxylesterase
VRDVELAVLDVKPTGAPIASFLFIHGFTGSKEELVDVALLLAEAGIRSVIPDNRGQNQSSHATTYGVHENALDAVELCHILELDRPHLVGHSLGGIIARDAVITAPESFSFITLLCSGPAAPHAVLHKFEACKEFLEPRTMVQARQELTAADENPTYFFIDPNPESLVSIRWDSSDKKSVLAHLDDIIFAPDRTAELAATGVKALVIYGENDDVWELTEQDDMAHRLGAEVVVIPNAGHCPNEDAPEILAQVLRRI